MNDITIVITIRDLLIVLLSGGVGFFAGVMMAVGQAQQAGVRIIYTKEKGFQAVSYATRQPFAVSKPKGEYPPTA